LKNSTLKPLSKAQHIYRAMYRRFRRLYGIVLVLNRRCGTSKIVDFVNLYKQRKCNVVAYELEARMRMEVFNIPLCSREKIVSTKNLVAFAQQTINQMRTEKAGSPSDQNPFAAAIKSCQFEPPGRYFLSAHNISADTPLLELFLPSHQSLHLDIFMIRLIAVSDYPGGTGKPHLSDRGHFA
jgi:hypothetical protein